MSLLALYVPRDSSFISTEFVLLHLDHWFVVSSSRLVFDIPLLYYIILYYIIIYCIILYYIFKLILDHQ